MKTHFFAGPGADDIERAPCGTWLGEGSGLSGMWERVDCRRCQAKKEFITKSSADEERAIVEQMGDMAEFMRAQDTKQEVEPMTSKPIAWRTEDYASDKSATTYDPAVAERWRAKGWPVWAMIDAGKPEACATCKGSRTVPDGVITGQGGVEYENGPVHCVRECPDCAPGQGDGVNWKGVATEQRAIIERKQEGLEAQWRVICDQRAILERGRAYLQRMIELSAGQDSIATGYLGDILDAFKTEVSSAPVAVVPVEPSPAMVNAALEVGTGIFPMWAAMLHAHRDESGDPAPKFTASISWQPCAALACGARRRAGTMFCSQHQSARARNAPQGGTSVEQLTYMMQRDGEQQ